jgi:LuxR family maltose regulon positive regulatory protein
MLEQLEHANLFLTPLDDERRWYRYHRLFADLLRKRLQQTQADHMPALHRRASEWFARNGYPTEAIEHALAAQDPARAAWLVEQAAEGALMRSEIVTFLGWVGRLPDEMVRARPGLHLRYTLALLISGHPLDAVESRLSSIETSSSDIAGQALLVRAYLAAFQGRFGETAELTGRALTQLPASDVFMRINAAS